MFITTSLISMKERVKAEHVLSRRVPTDESEDCSVFTQSGYLLWWFECLAPIDSCV